MNQPRPSWLPHNASDRALDEHTIIRWTERPISALGVGPGKLDAIAALGCVSLGDVPSRLDAIAALKGFGPSTMDQIRAALRGFATGE